MIFRKWLLFFLLYSATAFAQQPKLGDVADGNRSTPVHYINLFDETGSMIRLDDHPLLPFSTKQTCQECHDYDKISSGWHFNAAIDSVYPGRPGEPWILADPLSATQIPISYRNWTGTFSPDQIGMNRWDFILKFGRHLPGGGVGENEASDSPDLFFRRQVSGSLEINCLSCHSANPAQDQAEYALQINRQNFRWAATGASDLATVHGSAKNMSDNYDIYYGVDPDNSKNVPPSVEYDKTLFNSRGKVFFDLTRRIPNQRCYFCHSNKIVGENSSEHGHSDEDVHLVVGMLCVDCHRNGLDHNMVRGNEIEENPASKSFTCEGCHIGNEDEQTVKVGRLGAPTPSHKGIPPVHFDKLTCTTCHSGSWPNEITRAVKTSRAHALGTHGISKLDETVPHLQTPAFVKREDGKLTPSRVLWPSYWAYEEGDSLSPVLPDLVGPIIQNFIASDTLTDSTNFSKVRMGLWPEFTETLLVQVLDSLNLLMNSEKKSGYIAGGKFFKLSESGQLINEDHIQAQPYSWPIAHDVRPAVQSLGINGCDDCHSQSSPIYFGKVATSSPLVSDQNNLISMASFNDLGQVYSRTFALSFLFRPWLKIVIIISCVIIGLILILYILKGFETLIRVVANKENQV
jgi:hypothetical protein